MSRVPLSVARRRTLREWRTLVFFESQLEFAARLGVKAATLSSWERARHAKAPRFATRRQIAQVLGVPVSEIVWPGVSGEASS
jgi:transcriptional regulator with XRE-family HTH domain